MKKLLIACFLLVLLASVSAFTLTAELGTTPLDGDAVFAENGAQWGETYVQGEPAGSQGDGAYTLTTRHKADYPAVMVAGSPVNVTEGIETGEWGQFTLSLDGVWPKAFLRGGNCSGQTCVSGPNFDISVKRNSSVLIGSGWMPMGEKNGPSKTIYAPASDISFRVLELSVPDFKETWLKVNGKNQTWYLLRGENGIVAPGQDPGFLKTVSAEVCVSLLIDGSWSDCAKTKEELEVLVKDYLKKQSENSVSGITDAIHQSTGKTVASTDDAVQSTNGANVLDDEKLQQCTADLKKTESLFIAKTRFVYDKIGVNNSKDYSKWVMAMRDDWTGIEVSVFSLRPEEQAFFSFFLAEFSPKLVSSNGSTVVKEPRFQTIGSTEPIAEMLKTWTGHAMDCEVHESGDFGQLGGTNLNAIGTCTANRGNSTGFGIREDVIDFKIYKYEAPYFQETTEQEKTLFNRKELLREGPHCYDVWAYYAFRFKLYEDQEQYSPWIKSQEELSSFLETKKRGWNLRVSVAGVDGLAIENATVKVTGESDGVPWNAEAQTTAQGTSEFIAPTGTELEIIVSKHNYRDSEPVKVTIEDKIEKEITLLPGSYNMPLIFSTDDFWILYNKVLPAFLEPAQKTTDITLPKGKDKKTEYLITNFEQPISLEKQSNLYGDPGDCKVCEFFWWQTESCDKAGVLRIEMTITDIYKGLEITDYLGFEMKPLRVMIIHGLEYDKSYYSCTLIPDGDNINTLEVKWTIDGRGNIKWSDRKLLKPVSGL